MKISPGLWSISLVLAILFKSSDVVFGDEDKSFCSVICQRFKKSPSELFNCLKTRCKNKLHDSDSRSNINIHETVNSDTDEIEDLLPNSKSPSSSNDDIPLGVAAQKRNAYSSYVRIGKSYPTNFVRVGKAPGYGYVRIGRGSPYGYVRIGKSSPYGYVRIGKSSPYGYVRIGKASPQGYVRIGKASPNGYVRIGKSQPDTFSRFSKSLPQSYVRIGKASPYGYVRIGRSSPYGYVRIG